MFHQPFQELLTDSQSILLAGAGGGYDLFGSLPLAHNLTAAGKTVHFASLSFTALEHLFPEAKTSAANPLYRLVGKHASTSGYCPEAWLAKWLSSQPGSAEVPIWCFEKTGVLPLRSAYQHLVEHLGIDTIVLIDGGIDALLRGDESSLGTPAEDLTSIAAVAGLEQVQTVLACVGFGAELRDGIPHAQALERIAELTAEGHFLGAFALLECMPSVAYYLRALEYVRLHQTSVRQSHIHAVISDSIAGEFGFTKPDTWVSPLANIFWFFGLSGVARSHLFLENLEDTQTLSEVVRRVSGLRKSLRIRSATVIPL